MRHLPPRALVVSALLLAPAFASAQEVPGRLPPALDSMASGWNLGVGWARHGVRDEVASPLQHQGTGMLVGVEHDGLGVGGGWAFGLTYSTARVSSRVRTLRGGFEDVHRLDGRAAWERRVGRVGSVSFYAGADLALRAAFRRHHYKLYDWGGVTADLADAFVPLEASAAWTVPLGPRGRLRHRVALPVLTLALRTPWTGLRHPPSPRLRGPWGVWGFQSELRYRRALPGGRSVVVSHVLGLLRTADPLPFAWVVHRLGVSLALGS